MRLLDTGRRFFEQIGQLERATVRAASCVVAAQDGAMVDPEELSSDLRHGHHVPRATPPRHNVLFHEDVETRDADLVEPQDCRQGLEQRVTPLTVADPDEAPLIEELTHPSWPN